MLKANNLTNALDRRNEHGKTASSNVANGGPIAMKAFDYQQESLGGTRSIAADHKINKELRVQTPIRINDLFEQHPATPGSGISSDTYTGGKNIKRTNQLIEYLQI